MVYSTDTGWKCTNCGKGSAACKCSKSEREGKATPAAPPVKRDGVVRIRKERKGRNGKDVTVIAGVLLPADKLAALAKELKQKCGCGGSVKDSEIEIQGDHAQAIAELLRKRGMTVKGA